MATTEADPAFVDTNVLVHAIQQRSVFHARFVACLDQARRESRPLWISRQVMRKYAVRSQVWFLQVLLMLDHGSRAG